MNRADRVRKVIPGAPDDLIAALAAKPAAEVDVIVAALRQARRDALDHEKAKRRQRRADARAHHWYDERELADRIIRIIGQQGKRAARSLDALAGLVEAGEAVATRIDEAAVELRGLDYSDVEIAAVLGVTSAAIGQRYGAKRPRSRPRSRRRQIAAALQDELKSGGGTELLA